MKSREEVASVLRDIKSLPTLPVVTMKILQMSEDPNISLASVGEIVEKDPVIATRLLKLVNSPFYGVRREVTSIHQTLLILGFSSVKNLVLSSSVTDLFVSSDNAKGVNRRELWKHSIATAIAARTIAKRRRLADPEVAFTSGLIHDVGKVVIDSHFHEESEGIIQEMELTGEPMYVVESALLGVSHAEVGSYLAGRWNLPDILRSAVGFHHNPTEDSDGQSIASLIAVADKMARELGVGGGGGADPVIEEDVLSLCKLDLSLYEAIRDELNEEIHDQVGMLAEM
jgi:putative nucleotidyltransferase with HDIG domain